MSKTVQEIFNRLQEKKAQAKIVSRKYKEELALSHDYQKIKEEMDKLKAKKKTYEQSIKEQAGATFARIDELKLAISQDAQMLSDVALTTIMKGEQIQIKDQYVEYEPVFKVTFKKIK
jgi:hypothetical protein